MKSALLGSSGTSELRAIVGDMLLEHFLKCSTATTNTIYADLDL